MKIKGSGIPRPERGQGWYGEEALLPLTAGEVMGDLKDDRETLHGSDDIEIKEHVTRSDMEGLLVNDKEGEDIRADEANDLEEITVAQSQQDSHVNSLRCAEELRELQTGMAPNEPVFNDLLMTASDHMVGFGSRFGFCAEKIAEYFLRWPTTEIRWKHYIQQPPHIVWGVAGEVEEWKEFVELARGMVRIVLSENEVERTISTQRCIMGMKGTQFWQRVLTARTQIHQISKPSLV
jgi:hypothetical protein